MKTTRTEFSRSIVPGATLSLTAAVALLPLASAADIAFGPDTGNCGIGFNCGCADNGHGGCTGYRCPIYPVNHLLFPWCSYPY